MEPRKDKPSGDGCWVNIHRRLKQLVSSAIYIPRNDGYCKHGFLLGIQALGDEAHALGDCDRLHKDKMELFIDIKLNLIEGDLYDGNANHLYGLFKHLHGLSEEVQAMYWRRLACIVMELEELINTGNPAKPWKGYGLKQAAKKKLMTRVCLPLG